MTLGHHTFNPSRILILHKRWVVVVPVDEVWQVTMLGHESAALLFLELTRDKILLKSLLKTRLSGLLICHLHLINHLLTYLILDHIDEVVGPQKGAFFFVYVVDQAVVVFERSSLVLVVGVISVVCQVLRHLFHSFHVCGVLVLADVLTLQNFFLGVFSSLCLCDLLDHALRGNFIYYLLHPLI